jgi:hypothetical protein
MSSPAPLPLTEMDMAEPEAPKPARISPASKPRHSVAVAAKTHTAKKRRRKPAAHV